MRKRWVSGRGSHPGTTWDIIFNLALVPNYKLISVLFEPHSSKEEGWGVGRAGGSWSIGPSKALACCRREHVLWIPKA